MSETIVRPRTYVIIFAILICMTALTAYLSTVDFAALPVFSLLPAIIKPKLNGAVALIIAVFKASLVILFFMHAKYSPRLTKLVIISAFFWLGILLTLTLGDYFTRPIMPHPHL
jgi:cytochrome c oxidase subunit IV